MPGLELHLCCSRRRIPSFGMREGVVREQAWAGRRCERRGPITSNIRMIARVIHHPVDRILDRHQ